MKHTDIKNKVDLIQFIKEQINVELINDKENCFNNKRNVLYTQIPKAKERLVLSLLSKYKHRVEEHLDNYYWIYVKAGK